jgi:hypothetical protein
MDFRPDIAPAAGPAVLSDREGGLVGGKALTVEAAVTSL